VLTAPTYDGIITTNVVTRIRRKKEMQPASIANILGGKQAVRSRIEMIELSDKGVTKDALLRLASYLNLSLSEIATLLPITERTIQRYSPKQRFNRVVSEQVLQIAEVAARGAEVFGDREKLLSWINTPSTALGNRTPASLLSSRFGTEMVLDELGRVEHGIIS
jgi:putative toxin-antitoxin system antitoxin component (TIGR02293 family)